MRFILLLAILFQVNGNLIGSAVKDKHHHIQVNDSIISFFGKEPDGSPKIHYYKFYNGIQMIEFDYLTPYHERINYLEQAQLGL